MAVPLDVDEDGRQKTFFGPELIEYVKKVKISFERI